MELRLQHNALKSLPERLGFRRRMEVLEGVGPRFRSGLRGHPERSYLDTQRDHNWLESDSEPSSLGYLSSLRGTWLLQGMLTHKIKI